MVPNFLIWVCGSSFAPPVITQISNQLLSDVDAVTPLYNLFNHLLVQCGQAASGERGILFYSLKRGTSQVYVGRRRVKLSFGANHQ